MGLITVDLRDRKQLYEQIVDNVKNLILMGELSPDEKLPSVRELSKTITVNPNTVQKAYRELERQGYIYTTSGVGTFVADVSQITADAHSLELAKAALDDAFKQLLFLGLSYDEAREIAGEIMEQRRLSDD